MPHGVPPQSVPSDKEWRRLATATPSMCCEVQNWGPAVRGAQLRSGVYICVFPQGREAGRSAAHSGGRVRRRHPSHDPRGGRPCDRTLLALPPTRRSGRRCFLRVERALGIPCGHRLSDHVGSRQARSQRSGAQPQREAFMARRKVSFQAAFLAGSMLAGPAMAADVTPDRLLNADNEPQNWLMNHRTYDGQRFSPLARINRDTVRNLKLAYAVPLGGGAGNECSNATPLAEHGFLYVTDSWNVLYKIDTRSATLAASCGAWIPSRIVRCAAAARRSRAASSSPAPAVFAPRPAPTPPTRQPERRLRRPPAATHHPGPPRPQRSP